MSEEHRKKYWPERPRKRKLYPFYTVKDGDDCLKKSLTLAGYGGVAGTLIAGMTGKLASEPGTGTLVTNIIMRLPKYALSMAGAGALFATGICIASKVRGGKNDPLNHFVGGLAAGSSFGVAAKSQKFGWGMGFALAFAAAVWKMGKLDGWANPVYDIRREKAFFDYNRSFCPGSSRPDPEGVESEVVQKCH